MPSWRHRALGWAAWATLACVWVLLALRLPEVRALWSEPTTAERPPQAPAKDAPPPKPAYPGPPFGQEWRPEAVEGFLQTLAGSTDHATVFLAGFSEEGRPLYGVRTGAGTTGDRSQVIGDGNGKGQATAGKTSGGPWRVVIVAGQHGNEPAAVVGVLQFLWDLCREEQQAQAWMRNNLALLVFPLANPDGRARGTRETARQGDMNRDWEARKLPETAAIGRAIDAFGPDLVIDCHQLIPGDKYQDPLVEVACSDQTELTRMGRQAVGLEQHLERRLKAEELKPRVFFRWTKPGMCLHAYYGVNNTTPGILIESAPNPPGWQVNLHPKVLWTIVGYLRRGGQTAKGG